MKIITNIKINKGFTMVETLVAVSILMISVAGPLTIAQKGLMAAIYAKDQVTASFLALDAMEYIKNIRDNNVNVILGGGSGNWDDKISSCTESNSCKVDTTPSFGGLNPSSCSGSTCVLYNDGTGYKTSGTKTTQFSRYFYLKNVTANEATVVVKVLWNNGTIENVMVLEDQIFNIIR